MSKFMNQKSFYKCIIAHPVNPPYYAPMVEIIPHDLTTESVRHGTRDLMAKIGQKPVLLNREIDGFALNRIQYAVINESWRLVERTEILFLS